MVRAEDIPPEAVPTCSIFQFQVESDRGLYVAYIVFLIQCEMPDTNA